MERKTKKWVERRLSFQRSAVRAADREHDSIRCKNQSSRSTLETVSLCLSDDTLKAGGPFYLVSMPGEVKYPT